MLFRSGEKPRDPARGRDCAGHGPHGHSAVTAAGRVPSRWHVACLALSLCGAQAAHGADLLPATPPAPSAAERPDWTVQVTPYMWAASLKGDVSPFRRGPTISVENRSPRSSTT